MPELTRTSAITIAAAATMLPVIVQESVGPRRIGPPRPSCLGLGNLASSSLQAAAHHLADLLAEQGDGRGAIAAHQQIIDTGDTREAEIAMIDPRPNWPKAARATRPGSERGRARSDGEWR